MNPLETVNGYIMNLTKLEEGPAYMLTGGIMTALSIMILALVIGQLFGIDWVRKLLHRYTILSLLTKALAVGGTWLLAQSDYYSVYTIFIAAESLDPDTANFLSWTFAAFLEGFAFLLGIFLSRLTDSTNYRKSDLIGNLIGVITSSAALLFSWGLSIYQRTVMLTNQLTATLEAGATPTFGEVLKQADPDQLFMMISPILTSVLAFGLSWLAFPHSSLSQQEQEVEHRQNRYLRFSTRYKKQLMRYQQKKTRLWTALAGSDEGDILDMPADSNIYQSRCQQLIRRKTVSACVSAFSDEFGRYNKAIEAKLAKYITELSWLSTLPHLISDITVEEVLAKYEEQTEKKELDGDLWDSKKLRQDKQERLRRELDNAACQAEFWFSPKRKK